MGLGGSSRQAVLELYSRCDDIAGRLPTWHKLGELLRHAKALGPYAGLKAEADAIKAQRSQLAEPDPVRPLLDKVVELLRQALKVKLDAYPTLFREQEDLLAADADWNRLSNEIRGLAHLNPAVGGEAN